MTLFGQLGRAIGIIGWLALFSLASIRIIDMIRPAFLEVNIPEVLLQNWLFIVPVGAIGLGILFSSLASAAMKREFRNF